MSENPQHVTLTAIDIPFLRLVMFFIKAGLAAVPATLVLMVIFMLFGALMHGLFGMSYGGRFWQY